MSFTITTALYLSLLSISCLFVSSAASWPEIDDLTTAKAAAANTPRKSANQRWVCDQKIQSCPKLEALRNERRRSVREREGGGGDNDGNCTVVQGFSFRCGRSCLLSIDFLSFLFSLYVGGGP
jgi:hypothetical protein